jgi:HAD superfamily hydrolase (TIGR01509 family)
VIKAILWDVDGTLAETELHGHLPAFNHAFAALDIPWRWTEDRYGELLYVAGGRERLLHDMQWQRLAPSDPAERQALAERLHRFKDQSYARVVAGGGLPLREGVRDLMEDCERAGLLLGIVTTTGRNNVEVLLRTHLGKEWESKFATVVCAREAPKKKPHPQAYLLALQALHLHAHEVVAIEDAPAGAAAAQAAGVPVIVTRSYYFAAAGFRGALAVGQSLGRIDGWHPAADTPAARIDLSQIVRWRERSLGAP